MTNTYRIAEIRARAEAAKEWAVGCDRTNRGCQVPQIVKVLNEDIPYLLACLSAYEDTGLSPEDCAEYKKFEDEIIKSGKSFDYIIKLLQADKDERCVVLPCNETALKEGDLK